MFDPNNPMAGQMHTMGQQPMNALAEPQMQHQHNGGGINAYGAAKQDWRALRPDHPDAGGDMAAWHSAMMDWHQARPSHMNYLNHPQPQPGPITNPGMQGAPVPNMQFPPNPGFAAPGVGQSLNVQGMIPAASGYDLPTY